MTREQYENIKTVSELPSGVEYYSNEYERHGASNHWHWVDLYDKAFNIIDSIHVGYTNVLKNVKRICKSRNAENIEYVPYKLTDLNNGFFLVEEKDSTEEGLLQATRHLDIAEQYNKTE